MEILDSQSGNLCITGPMQTWQHVSMLAEETNGDDVTQKFVFAELCYSHIDANYVSVRKSVLNPNEPAEYRQGCCALCCPSKLSPHPADSSKYVVGHASQQFGNTLGTRPEIHTRI